MLEEEGWRCARRYGWGESLAKVSLGKDRVEGEPVEAIIEVCTMRLCRANSLMKLRFTFRGELKSDSPAGVSIQSEAWLCEAGSRGCGRKMSPFFGL